MCKVVINKLNLGARELGYELFDGKQIIEMTGSQIVKAIKSGEDIRGMVVNEKDELELDRDGFFTRNLMVKSHINNFKPLMEDETVMMNLFYIILGSKATESGAVVYPAITTRFAREELTEEKLKALYDLGAVSAGVKIEGDVITLPTLPKLPVTGKSAEMQEEAGLTESGKTEVEEKSAMAKKTASK